MAEVLDDIHQTGETPGKYISKEEKNKIGPDHVSKEQLEKARELVIASKLTDKYRFVFVDGIMLYHDNSPVARKFDVRFFLRASYEELKKRREARAGYVTIDGFWQDPPGYFEDIVWPSYVQYHKHLFANDDVESDSLSTDAVDLDLHMPGQDVTAMPDILTWAINVLRESLTSDSLSDS
ncbi:ribosylnicotinamide kinase [Sugiyamaella lignohabitans]|uniref:Ribosylnicotinamide kinase n=1 Tax=Sugiyamaella lignohabitans TaxID=796027 RepID=A0A167EJL2_9ASCO|nr:ribosylnicotinamide kinase [Sugiyamaella lignohabitans]ANB14154.1 ribosylnicotinamide kinase [Sugiyamaella lignohabitans]